MNKQEVLKLKCSPIRCQKNYDLRKFSNTISQKLLYSIEKNINETNKIKIHTHNTNIPTIQVNKKTYDENYKYILLKSLC